MIDIQNYIAGFKDFPLLTAAEERRLLVLIRTPPEGTPPDVKEWPLTPEQLAARDEFMCRNIRLVIHSAKKFCRLEDSRMMDLIGEGVYGMMYALGKFDIDLGVRFSTYANWWIQAKIRNEIQFTESKVIRHKTLHHQYRRLRNKYLQSGYFVDDARLFEELGWNKRKIDKFYEDQACIKISLDTIDSSANDFVSADDALLVDPPQDEIIEDMHKAEQKILLAKALDILEPIQRDVIRRRFGLDELPTQTFDEIATVLEIPREKVRQIENKALSKLWRYIRRQAPSLCD